MENKTPIQQAIEMFKSEMKGIEENPMIGRDEKLAYSSQYENFIERLESLLPKEKAHGESIWTAAEKYTREDDRSIHGHEFENLSKVEFFNKLYPKK